MSHSKEKARECDWITVAEMRRDIVRRALMSRLEKGGGDRHEHT